MAKRWGPGNPLWDWQHRKKSGGVKTAGRGKGKGRARRYYAKAKRYTSRARMHLGVLIGFLAGLLPTFVKAYDGWISQGPMGAIGNTIYGWTGIRLDTSQGQWTYAGWDPKGMIYGLVPCVTMTGIGWGVSKLATKTGVNRAMPKGWGI